MLNKLNHSGEGPALQVSKPAWTAGLIEETEDGSTLRAEIREFAFDGLRLVIDNNRLADKTS